MIEALNHSPNSPFSFYPGFKFSIPIDLTKFSEFLKTSTEVVTPEPIPEFNDIIFEQPSLGTNELSIVKEEPLSNDSSENTENRH